MEPIFEYFNIIVNRLQNPLPKGASGAKHHIYPKSLGGWNLKCNIVKLTHQEHYRCHCLLPTIFKEIGDSEGYKKMLSAWHFTHTTSDGVEISADEYALLQEEYAKSQSRRYKGRKQSPEAIANMKKAQSNRSEEWRRNISKSKMGNKYGLGKRYKRSEETKKRISIQSRKTMSDPNVRAKISASLTGKVQSEATKEKRRQKMLEYWAKRKAAQHLQS